jgi:hypothetical protein
MVEATRLSSMQSMSSQHHHLHTKFHPNPPHGSNVIKVFLYTHLRSLNVHHFLMAEAMRLKMWHRGHLEWQYEPTKFHENSTIGSKFISRKHTHTHTHTHRQTHRQAGDLISPLSFFEIRLISKMYKPHIYTHIFPTFSACFVSA